MLERSRAQSPFYTRDHEAFRDVMRSFVSREIEPYASQWDEAGEFPRELYAKAAAIGLLALGFPEDCGGVPADQFMKIVASQELARAGAGGISASLMSHTIGSPPIARAARPDIKARVLAEVLSGLKISALAITEPSGGSDVANLRTKARRDGDHYVVNGEKTSISAADQADAAVVFGRTGAIEAGAHGVTALLIPTDLPGLTRNRFDCHGQRAIGRGSLFFENVRVPVSHRLGAENKGFVQVMQGFDFSRALIGLQVLAVARVALEETWAYVAQRNAFGKPLSAFQGVSHPLADFDTQIEAARLLCLQALWLKDRGAPHSAEAAMCKWWAPKLAYDAIHQCLLSFGHGGYDRGPMEQRLRDVLGFQIGDGTAQIMKTIIARARAGREAVPA
jgi:cyclohexanecarboxyl-CoA dehydrogenase